jgi:ATP-dependent protease ClpP protease subunit
LLRSSEAETRVAFYGEIERGCAGRFIEQFASHNRLVVFVDSPGGSGPDGFALGKFLASKPDTFSIVTGRCHSAAMFLMLGANRRMANSSAQFLQHPCSITITGTAVDLRAAADLMEVDTPSLVEWTAERTGVSLGSVAPWFQQETIFDANQAQRLGLIHSINDIEVYPSAPPGQPAGEEPDPDFYLAAELAEAIASLSVRDKETIQKILSPWLIDFRDSAVPVLVPSHRLNQGSSSAVVEPVLTLEHNAT